MNVVGYIAVGTYARTGAVHQFAVKYGMDDNGEGTWSIDHQASTEIGCSVKCLAHCPERKSIIAGDDRGSIHMLNMHKDDSDTMELHSDAITSLSVRGNSILAAAADGNIAIVDVENGLIDHVTTKSPSRRIYPSLAVHPSGRLALSVNGGRVLTMWDLEHKKSALTVKLDRARYNDVQFVCFPAEEGGEPAAEPNAAVTLCRESVDVYSLADNFSVPTFSLEVPTGGLWTCMHVCGGTIYVGDSLGNIHVVRGTLEDIDVAVQRCHRHRVNTIQTFPLNDGAGTHTMVVSTDSFSVTDSGVALWVDGGEAEEPLMGLADAEIPAKVLAAMACSA
ncbi:Trp-Asp (WD) repeats circular [Carpediemonas membranifera]|uniref:Trp-Asp (WD) repeats circular n=1 Tax=Carpediemonas membranifera TaxID=201153 RepID=A0A8J6B1T8_9EUKA|nr:Trp-Asp (WD) repeats circular [Carpediemonas membranifera]|eukprot:KAG9397445.1 Trp-Asp (WD) repeats circular [Carpediemonas membranifera]